MSKCHKMARKITKKTLGQAAAKCNGHVGLMARELEVTERTIYRALEKHKEIDEARRNLRKRVMGDMAEDTILQALQEKKIDIIEKVEYDIDGRLKLDRNGNPVKTQIVTESVSNNALRAAIHVTSVLHKDNQDGPGGGGGGGTIDDFRASFKAVKAADQAAGALGSGGKPGLPAPKKKRVKAASQVKARGRKKKGE